MLMWPAVQKPASVRCISYLTIELKGRIPLEFRSAIGNRIFGCDDCQLVCPWNKFARPTTEDDFSPRHELDDTGLIRLFRWTQEEWDEATRGSALRRAGYEGWLRNIAIALGNANSAPSIIAALRERAADPSDVVPEHVTARSQIERTDASPGTPAKYDLAVAHNIFHYCR